MKGYRRQREEGSPLGATSIRERRCQSEFTSRNIKESLPWGKSKKKRQDRISRNTLEDESPSLAVLKSFFSVQLLGEGGGTLVGFTMLEHEPVQPSWVWGWEDRGTGRFSPWGSIRGGEGDEGLGRVGR